MKILVTGGTGFIGSHLMDFLLSKSDAEIYALVRDPSRLKTSSEKSGIALLKGDLFSIPPLPSQIDLVFHLAGLTKALKSVDYYTVNQKGTASLFRCLQSQKQRPKVVHLSSLAAGGPSRPGRAVREDDPPCPVSAYGDSKLKAEQEALRHAREFPLIILRVAAVFGPGDEDFLSYFRFIKKGILPLFGRGQRCLSLCYVRDLVRALDVCARADVAGGEIFHIADEKPYSWEDIAEAAARVMNKKPMTVRIPLWAARWAAAAAETASGLTGKPSPVNRSKYRDMKQFGWVADVQKAKIRLGFETAYPLDAAMKETIDWCIAQKLL